MRIFSFCDWKYVNVPDVCLNVQLVNLWMTGITRITQMTRITRMTRITGLNKITRCTRITRMNGVTRMTSRA